MRDINTLRGFLDAQAEGLICGRHEHSFKIALPVQKRNDTREVFTKCATCGRETWMKLPEQGYARFLRDLEDGKII